MSANSFDVVVIGAGCFGAWTAHELVRAGRKVLLLDAWGAAHSRASSGGESRITRAGYGPDELYTRWSVQSLDGWKQLAARARRPLFHPCGMLWLSGEDDGYTRATQHTLARVGVDHELLSVDDLGRRFPQVSTHAVKWALFEPGSGALMARQAVQALVDEAVGAGVDYRVEAIVPPVDAGAAARGRLARLTTASGATLAAGEFVFACGPWLPKLFPDLLGSRLFPTRQEVFFFAPPAGDRSFSAPAMPCWLHHPALVYGIPDIENRGFKISLDRHGPPIDPDSECRIANAELLALVREHLALRFPKLRHAALTESRVCQYENTSNGDFIIDRHPDLDDVLIVGGGSGHGFKHGPAVGAYVRGLLAGDTGPEPRFALATKGTMQQRGVY